MNSKLLIGLTASMMAFGLSACMQESAALFKRPGTYETSSTTTDWNGTTIQRQNSTKVDVNENGHKRAVITSKTTRDPKGLFNKNTTQSKKVIEERR